MKIILVDKMIKVIFELLFELVGPNEIHVGGQNAKGPTMLRPRPWTNGHSTLKYPPSGILCYG